MAADAEVITFVSGALRALGVPAEAVRVRLSDVRIFRALAKRSGFDEESTVAVKECLDALAECRAGKLPERVEALTERLGN
ncbi:ATP phosphoribosyltransferase regulatory subunit [Thermobifida halotolerans]|uniref:ATP phosphoribosyltransferase regulatory subunit n=1 Tax=Thermobifida halotolerans TaxID=483545 RepID=A0A399FXW6_9ACTN|nr:ATP phosphoribosyltransferase regulatory subunit [Thermobifida halotolerans]